MQATLNHHTPTRKSVEVTVPAKEVTAAFDEVVAGIAPKVRIPGFRPGKAPKSVLITKFRKEIHQDVAERLVQRYFWAAATEAGTQPISNPALDKLELKDGADAVFRAQYDVAPVVELPDYKSLELTKRKRQIDDEAVSEQLEAMRQRATRFVPVEGAAAAGHIVTCDIKVKPEGQKKAQVYTDQVLELNESLPFRDQIVGMKADDTKTFEIAHAATEPNPALAGKTISYEVTVKDVRAKELPELNDEFAKDMGAFDSLEALKAQVRKDLEEAAERDAITRLQGAILDTLLDAAAFEAPRSMVALQLDDYCNEFAQTISRQGVDPNRINWQAYRQHRLNDAERAVRSGYLLQTIGNTEDIQVSDEEIDAEVRAFMEENKIQEPFATFKADLERRGATTEIKGRIRTDKIFERLLSFAKVAEELLDKAAFEAVIEAERKREAGMAQARYDAGGVAGGDLDEQEGGEPVAVAPAHEHVHGPDCDHDHEPKPKKTAKKAPKAEAAAEEAPAAEAKPKKAAAKKAEAAPAEEEAPKAKKTAAKKAKAEE